MADWVGWAVDLVVGILVGILVGGIVAVNTVIYSGVSDGYQASPTQVFDERPFAGGLAIVALLAAPALMVWTLRRRRRTSGS